MPDHNKQPPIAVLVAVSTVGPLALNIFMPSMPRLPAVFGTDYGTVQLTLGLYLAGIAFGQLAYGPLSDRFGRRPMLLGGLGLFLAGTLVAMVATSIEVLIAGRVIQALGGCSGLVLARAIVRFFRSPGGPRLQERGLLERFARGYLRTAGRSDIAGEVLEVCRRRLGR